MNRPKKGACVTLVLQLGLGNVQNKCQHELSLALVTGPLLHVPYKRKRREYFTTKNKRGNKGTTIKANLLLNVSFKISTKVAEGI
jgi:hypothetical protein